MPQLGRRTMFGLRLSGLSLLALLTSCSSVNHNLGDERWFNASLPIHLQHTFFEQEQAFCRQAADQWIPVPDVHFSFNGVRQINGAAKVSVEGYNAAATSGPTAQSNITGLSGSNVGFWKMASAATMTNYRESRDTKRCLTSLGWQTTNDTWDGTPSDLNESIALNKSVMTLVKQGYRHPMIGEEIVALIDMSKSAQENDRLTLHISEIPFFNPDVIYNCTYVITNSWFSRRGEVTCDGMAPAPVQVEPNNPISKWIEIYF